MVWNFGLLVDVIWKDILDWFILWKIVKFLLLMILEIVFCKIYKIFGDDIDFEVLLVFYFYENDGGKYLVIYGIYVL